MLFRSYINWIVSLPALVGVLLPYSTQTKMVVFVCGLLIIVTDMGASAICYANRRWQLFAVSLVVLLLGILYMCQQRTSTTVSHIQYRVGERPLIFIALCVAINQFVWVLTYGTHTWCTSMLQIIDVVIDGLIKMYVLYVIYVT